MGPVRSLMESEPPSKHDESAATPGAPESVRVQPAENAMSEPLMTQSDVELVNAARGGDRDAFKTLVDRHYDLIFRVGFREMKDPDRAKDLTQEVCMRLPVKLKSFAGRSRFKTWLHRVVVNEARDWIRKDDARRKYEGKLPRDEGELARDEGKFAKDEGELAKADAHNGAVDGGQPELSEELDRALSEELDRAKKLLERLPKGMRDTFCLVKVLEFTQKEAAEILGTAPGTVAWRVDEACNRLTAWITQEEERVS